MKKNLKKIEALLEIMDRLRVECPWDREQTMLTLRTNTIEECFELTDAIVTQDMDQIREELGDLLLHIVFYSKIASEQSAFELEDVIQTVCEKLIYRHPHVFASTQVENADDVKRNWEKLKQRKKISGGRLSGVPSSMPALPKAYRIGQKAASAGFDWQDKQDVWAKVKEEIAEVEVEIRSGQTDKLEQEFGDLFFALTSAARLYNIDPETALERANRKFIRRFEYVEQKATQKELSLHDMSLAQMDELWDEAKKTEKI